MADKKDPKKLTDEELAQRVLDAQKIADEMKRRDWNMSEPFYGQLKKPVEVTPGDPVITKRVPDPAEMTPPTREGRSNAQTEPAPREGVVYLANTSKDGTRERGQMIPRKMFKSDEEFDAFVQKAKEQGNLWDHEKDEAPMNGGGGFLQRVKKAAAALTSGATGAGGGSGSDGAPGGYVSPDARSQSVGQAQSTTPTPAYADAKNPANVATGAIGAEGAGGGPPSNAAGPSGAQGGPQAPTMGGGTSPLEQLNDFGKNVITTAGDVIKDAVLPWRTWDRIGSGAEALGSAVGPGQVAPPQALPDSQMPPTPGGNVPPAPGPVSTSASMKVKGPVGMGGGFPKPQNPQLDAMQKAVDEQKAAVMGAAEVERTRAGEEARLNSDQAAFYAKQQEQVAKQQEYIDTRAKGLMDQMIEAQKILESPAKTPDPERYWKNHSKIMFAIGVGLLSQAGRDIGPVLGNVQHAIDADIEQQKAEFEAPRNAAKAKIAGAQNLYGMLRNMGADAFEAQKMGIAISNDKFAREIQKLAMSTKSDEVKFLAQQKVAELQQNGLKAMAEMENHSRMAAVAEFKAQTDRGELELKRNEFQQKQAAGGGQRLPAVDAEKIGKLQTAMKLLEQSSKDFDAVSGSIPDALLSKGTQYWPRSAADNYNKSRKAFLRTIGLLVDESVIQKHDADAWEELYPEAGNLNGRAPLNALMQSVREKYSDKLGSYQKAGYNTREFEASIGNTPNPNTRPGPNGVPYEKRADGLWYPVGGR